MFLVIPIVEFLHVLGVDINVHHENPATFLCHVSVSSVNRSRHRFASSRWHPVLTPEAEERHETPTGEHLSTRPRSVRHPRGHAASKAADYLLAFRDAKSGVGDCERDRRGGLNAPISE